MIVWVNIDGDRRPEGRLVHVIGKRAITRKLHGWGAHGPRVGLRTCIEQATHPFLTSDRRTWGVDIDVRCFNHRGHGRLGDSWAATVRVIAADRYDDAPGRLAGSRAPQRAGERLVETTCDPVGARGAWNGWRGVRRGVRAAVP